MAQRHAGFSTRSKSSIVVLVAAGLVSMISGATPTFAAPSKTPPGFVVTADHASGPSQPGRGTPGDAPGAGMRWADLQTSARGSACDHAYETMGAAEACTHGPDPAAAGVDVTHDRDVETIAADTAASTSATSSSTSSAATPLVPCFGDGTTGNRIQAIYAHAPDRADRYDELVSLFPQWAAITDKVFADSAAKTGGVRHLRFVTKPDCSLDVLRVQLSTNGDDSFTNTMTELKNLGFDRTDRKYIVWVDATYYCGIGSVKNDDRASGNLNDVGPSYARVDSGCWGATNPVEAHEIMHNIGGVQLSAPHSSGGWHCTDENDRMCYSDASGVTMSYVCTSAGERLFDCNGDDYFNTAPPAGSYCALHWNTANSAYLERRDPDAAPPSTTTTTAAPTTTTTVAPKSMVTDTFTGSLSKRRPSLTFTLSSGAGDVTGRLTFTKTSSMRVTMRAPSGSVVATASGPSAVTWSSTVTEVGTYTVVVDGATAGSFSVSVTHPTT